MFTSSCYCGCEAYTGRNMVRYHNEKRVDATARNLKNRAAKKERATYKVKYPGIGKAAWPAKLNKR